MRTHNPATGIVTCKCDASSIVIHERLCSGNLCHLCGIVRDPATKHQFLGKIKLT